MEPVSTTLAAIALVKAGLEHASDLKDIGSSIDNLLSHRDEKKPEETQQQKVLRQRTGEDGQDDTSISAVMDEVLAERTHQIALDNLALEINKKWPTEKGEPTTWDIILKTREEKIQRAKKQKIKKQEADDKFYDVIMSWIRNITIIIGFGIITALAGWLIYANRCVNATCT
tara:strand:- start:229 stop:744 length:516 start_codon:yes stop_codon:yes gene_type:complete